MTITNELAWRVYNTLANQLRESITNIGIRDLNIRILGEFRFVNNDISIDFHMVEGTDVIVGLMVKNNEVNLITNSDLGEEKIVSLYDTSVNVPDLVGLLEQLEQYVGH